MSTQTLDVIPVPGPDNPDRVYVTLVPHVESGMVVVRPGPSGKRLPRFWPQWFQRNVLNQVTQGVRVEISGELVRVSCVQGLSEALHIAEVAAQPLRGLGACPLLRTRQTPTFSTTEERVWVVRQATSAAESELSLERVKAIAAEINLPEDCKLSIGIGWFPHGKDKVPITVTLSRRRPRGRTPLPPIGDLGRLVELHYALAAAATV